MNGDPLHPVTAVWPGSPYPRGATWDGEGVNFALFSAQAERVELCIFDPSGRRELQRITLPECTDEVWHCYLPEARPGLLYGYRVHGPYRPEEGLRFNPHKLVLEPYAKHISGRLRWSDALFGYRIGSRREDLSMDRRDSAPGMPKCRVIDPAFTWGEDKPPRIPWRDTVIYELHVGGFTRLNPLVPPQLRGTYSALATAPVIDYLKRLGVTTIELMPVHAFVDDRRLVEQGLRNYWGYNTLGYFAPDLRYSATGRISEFKTMVKALHSAGLEVVLDVVYNHTAEGNQLGPTLSLRGIDNAAYYRLAPDAPRYYQDYTGCGNTLNMQHPRVLQLIMDSLRYWVQEMHVDGFRFDLASALARELHDVDRLGAFFDIIQQDPVLSQVKLIAEPWDLGQGGYQVGNFPVGWAEWNDRFRDTVRGFWRGDPGLIGDLAFRVSGSSDLYGNSGRTPQASINYVTAHDGFTLWDLVSYNVKHNEANGEANRDGHEHNVSWNCGVEGETEEEAVLALRRRQQRNLLASLLLSQGVPMLTAGDELGRTQGGNNNAYCQDNAVSWVDWTRGARFEPLTRFVRRVLALRRAHPIFRRKRWFLGEQMEDQPQKDMVWLTPGAVEMTLEDWGKPFARCLGLYLCGPCLTELDQRGERLRDRSFLVLFNAHHEPIDFRLPDHVASGLWEPLIDTVSEDGVPPSQSPLAVGAIYPLQARSVVVLREVASPG